MLYAPDSVKVNAKIASGGVSVRFKILAIRRVSICVFPVPGPAITMTGPSIASTALRCSLLSALYDFSNWGEVGMGKVYPVVSPNENNRTENYLKNNWGTGFCVVYPM